MVWPCSASLCPALHHCHCWVLFTGATGWLCGEFIVKRPIDTPVRSLKLSLFVCTVDLTVKSVVVCTQSAQCFEYTHAHTHTHTLSLTHTRTHTHTHTHTHTNTTHTHTHVTIVPFTFFITRTDAVVSGGTAQLPSLLESHQICLCLIC